MPIVLLIIAVATLFGIGSYFLKPSDAPLPELTVKDEPLTPSSTSQTETTPAFVKPVEPIITTATTDVPVKPTVIVTPTPTPTPKTAPAPTPASNPASNSTPQPLVTSKFKDGSYTVSSSYVAPGRTTHTVDVTLTVLNDQVTAANVVYGGDYSGTSEQYQKQFSSAYKSEVISKTLDSISLSRVGGASLTSGAFNKAMANIVQKARP